jgi:hypothetical protein
MMKETPWHRYTERGERFRIRVEYGIDYEFARTHRQTADFSITGETMVQARNNRWIEDSVGMIHDEIRAHMPQLAPYLKWHLVGPDGPMYYYQNAGYWFQIAQGAKATYSENNNPIEAFKRVIVFGAFPGDEAPPELAQDLEHGRWRRPGASLWKGPKEWSPGTSASRFFKNATWPDVQAWLAERLPKLLAAWVVDMNELGVLEP